MEEDDEYQSLPSPGDPSTSKSLARDGLALMVSPPKHAASGRRRIGGGGRDDCWSEEATEILINAWGERFLELKRGNLKQQHWKQVAEIVNRDNKSAKTDIQCKNRIDTVKKKFKQEKAKIAAGDDYSNTKWIFSNKLERLIGAATTTATTANKALKVTPLSSRSSLCQRQAKSSSTGVKRSGDSTRWHFRKRVASETESESEPDLSVDSGGDSLPPMLLPPPVRFDKTELGEVAMAIFGFVESYEKVETLKLEQMVELEKERMMFAKELELQRMQFFKAQSEMLRNSQEDRDSGRRIRRSHHSVKDRIR